MWSYMHGSNCWWGCQPSMCNSLFIYVFHINYPNVIMWIQTAAAESVVISFIGGGNPKKTTDNSLTYKHNVVSSTPCNERDSNLQLHWWYALIIQVVVNPTIIRSRLCMIISLYWFCSCCYTYCFVSVPSQDRYFDACPKPEPISICLSQARTYICVPTLSQNKDRFWHWTGSNK
jgi:hypothetical protein